MTITLKCDGCGELVDISDFDDRVGWLQVRCYEEREEKPSYFATGDSMTVVGHCCSIRCLANLALAHNEEPA